MMREIILLKYLAAVLGLWREEARGGRLENRRGNEEWGVSILERSM
tara:strand:- start:587 stop:724 length:138 start_codon:yes stop_codon:yes gene_type:complete